MRAAKPLAQISREHSIHPGLPSQWREELAENTGKAFSGNENQYKDQARIAELERLLGQAHAEIELLKKAALRYIVWVRNALFLYAQLCELCDSAVLLRKH